MRSDQTMASQRERRLNDKYYGAGHRERRHARTKLAHHPRRKLTPAEDQRRLRVADSRRFQLHSAKGRAKRAGVDFDLTVSDMEWPEFCPVLGIRLIYEPGVKGAPQEPGRASLDRTDPTLGYTLANTRVISQYANLLKGNNNLDTLRDLVAYLEGLNQP